jgi:hypothetical protein
MPIAKVHIVVMSLLVGLIGIRPRVQNASSLQAHHGLSVWMTVITKYINCRPPPTTFLWLI